MERVLETVAIIPARGGSKGILRKNIQDINGKPLLAYTIEVACQASLVGRVVVSTDDEEVAQVAREWGADVPFLRPRDIAGDRALISDAVEYTLSGLKEEGYVPDAVVELYPTHPFRTPKLVDMLLSKLWAGYSCVITAKPIHSGCSGFCRLTGEGRIKRLVPRSVGSGDGPTLFRPHGLLLAHSLRPSLLGVYVYHVEDPVTEIDIDEHVDLALARAVIEYNMFDFGL